MIGRLLLPVRPGGAPVIGRHLLPVRRGDGARVIRRLVLAAALIAALAALASPLAAARSSHARHRHPGPAPVPHGFVGMNLDGPLFNGTANLSQAFHQMVSSGVESVRLVFSWAQAQPQANGPIDYSETDAMVGDAARVGLTVLPIVIYAPSWDAQPHRHGTYAAPATDAPYAEYLAALVRRYGPAGTFWSAHPGIRRLPVHMWQVWNEPNLEYYWASRPWVPGYVSLLAAAHAAVRSADPTAQVVLAGFPDTAWRYLSEIYRAGGGHDFEIVAAHPYTARPRNVIRFLRYMRGTMRRHSDRRKPLLVTETGWSSSYPGKASDNFCCQTTLARQASNISALLPLLARYRRPLNLLGFYYYTWAGQEYIGARSFNFAGLFDINYNRLVPKPAYSAFRAAALALEHCRRKGTASTRCLARG